MPVNDAGVSNDYGNMKVDASRTDAPDGGGPGLAPGAEVNGGVGTGGGGSVTDIDGEEEILWTKNDIALAARYYTGVAKVIATRTGTAGEDVRSVTGERRTMAAEIEENGRLDRSTRGCDVLAAPHVVDCIASHLSLADAARFARVDIATYASAVKILYHTLYPDTEHKYGGDDSDALLDSGDTSKRPPIRGIKRCDFVRRIELDPCYRTHHGLSTEQKRSLSKISEPQSLPDGVSGAMSRYKIDACMRAISTVARLVRETFPNLSTLGMDMRRAFERNQNGWCLPTWTTEFSGEKLRIHVVAPQVGLDPDWTDDLPAADAHITETKENIGVFEYRLHVKCGSLWRIDRIPKLVNNGLIGLMIEDGIEGENDSHMASVSSFIPGLQGSIAGKIEPILEVEITRRSFNQSVAHCISLFALAREHVPHGMACFSLDTGSLWSNLPDISRLVSVAGAEQINLCWSMYHACDWRTRAKPLPRLVRHVHSKCSALDGRLGKISILFHDENTSRYSPLHDPLNFVRSLAFLVADRQSVQIKVWSFTAARRHVGVRDEFEDRGEAGDYQSFLAHLASRPLYERDVLLRVDLRSIGVFAFGDIKDIEFDDGGQPIHRYETLKERLAASLDRWRHLLTGVLEAVDVWQTDLCEKYEDLARRSHAPGTTLQELAPILEHVASTPRWLEQAFSGGSDEPGRIIAALRDLDRAGTEWYTGEVEKAIHASDRTVFT